MLLLPKTIGPITLVRKMGTGGVAESYMAVLRGSPDKQVVVRRVLPYVVRDPDRARALEARVRDLLALNHPHLVRVVEWIVDGDERYIVEERVDGLDLRHLLNWCRTHGRTLPGEVYLNLATQICNGLDAIHGSVGKSSGADSLVHLGLKPNSIFVTREGEVIIGGYGLTPSPTLLPQGSDGGGAVPFRMEYLSPEQTKGDLDARIPSDVFSLGSILYELLTLEPLFKAETGLQTIHRIRRGEITSNLLKTRALMPGLDRILYRALSRKPAHRYQRTFTMREDLRGLMSSYSFGSISVDTRNFLAPFFGARTDTTDSTDDPSNTAAFLSEPPPSGGVAALGLEPIDTQETTQGEIDENTDDLGPALVLDAPHTDSSPSDPNDGEVTDWGSRDDGRADEIRLPPPDEAQDSEVTGDTTGELLLLDEDSESVSMSEGSAPHLPSSEPSMAPTPAQNREANEALRNIRAAAKEEWVQEAPTLSHHRRVTYIAALGGMLLIFALAAFAWVLSGHMEEDGNTRLAEERTENPPPLPSEPTNTNTDAPAPGPSEGPPPPASLDGFGEFAAASDAAEPLTEGPAPTEGVTEPAPNRTDTARREAPRTSRPESRQSTEMTGDAISRAAEQDAMVHSVLDSPDDFRSSQEIDIDWDHYDDRAERGQLSRAEQSRLSSVPQTDEDAYTRSRALLLMNAQQTEDDGAARRYLDELFRVPNNLYNPLYLTAEAQLQVNEQRYEAALHSANRAELRWQDIPSELIVDKLSEILEVRARAHQGLFHQSEDLEDLDDAIDAWVRYQEHATRHSRTDLSRRAANELADLESIRERLR